jgi:uncharacterized membrane protein
MLRPKLAGSAPDSLVRPLVAVLWHSWLPWLLLGLGVVMRVRQYAVNRSLWLDEAMLAGNIVTRSYGELLRPLADHQGAPLGWLWLERTAVLAFGEGERALRLVPLVAGMAVLPVTLHVARRLLPSWLAPIALAFVAVSPFLIRYSSEAKQYETDALGGLVLLALSLPLVSGPLDRRRLFAWSAAAALIVWCSHPAVFFAAGFAAVLLAARLVRREWTALATLAAACLPWASSMLVNYHWFLHRLGADDTLLRYFAPGFPPEPASQAEMAAWLADRWQTFVRVPLGLHMTAVVAVLALAGLAGLVRTAPVQAALLVAPVPLFVAAAALHRYPLEGRLALALVPVVLLAMVAGADWGWPRGVAITAGLVALGVLFVPTAASTVAFTLHPRMNEDLRPVLQTMRQQLRRGDVILVDTGARPAFTYYAARLGIHGDAILRLGRKEGGCDDRQALARLAGGQRMWAVFSHRPVTAARDNQPRIHARLLGYAPQVATVQRQNARADLYDPAAPASVPDVAPSAFRRGDCLQLDPFPATPRD